MTPLQVLGVGAAVIAVFGLAFLVMHLYEPRAEGVALARRDIELDRWRKPRR